MTDLARIGFAVETSGIVKGERALDSLASKGEKTERRLDKSVKSTNSNFMSLRNSIGLAGAALTALGSAALTREIVAYSDSWKNVNSQLKQVTDSEEELLAVRKQLLDVSRETRTDLTGTVELYTVLDRATSRLGVSSQEQIDITRTMNNMFLASGKSAAETSGAIRQLSQGLESGALRGDEFNSVAEGAPRILDAISNSTGIARGELRDFAATGGITAEILVKALQSYGSEAAKAAKLTEMTFGQSLEVASTNAAEFVGQSKFMNSAVGALSSSIVDLSEALLENGKYVELFFSRFSIYGKDVRQTADIIEGSFVDIVNSSAETFPILAKNSETVFDQIIDGFKNLPENIRAFIQILTIELAHLVDLGLAYGESFAGVLGVQFGAIIDKAKIWGSQIANALNPFEDDISFESELNQIELIASEMTNSIIGEAVKRAELVRQVRLDSISTILEERDASISAYKSIAVEIGKVKEETFDLTKAQNKLFANFKETKEVAKYLIPKASSDDLEDLIDQVDSFGGAWTNTGNVIADTFGNIADSINDYSKRVTQLNSIQMRIDKERQKSGADTVALNKLQLKVNDELAMAEIDNYQAMAGAAAGMFSEKTAAAKAFNAINQALAIAEIALSYQKIAAGTTETAAHVANEGTKQSANALTAITSAFAAPFPVNFAMGAAMIGIMSSLIGGSFGGGGSSYEMPEDGGTGTVLGDPTAQSASISNISAKYEDLQIDQLAELKGIRNSMTKLSSGIQNLAQSFATDLNFTGSDLQLENSNFLDTGIGGALRKINPVAKVADWIDSITGDFLGLGGIVDKVLGGFSSKKQKLIDSGITFMSQTMAGIFESGELEANMYNVIETTKKKFWGLSKKTSTNTETQGLGGAINEQMGEIFGYLGESVIAAAESLGMDAKHIITTGIESLGLEDALKTFVIDIGDVSFLDKTGEEIQKELEAIFSQQGDLMAEYLVPSIKEYQQVGEGAFETLQRVAYEQAIFNDSLERTGKSLSDLSNLMQIDVAQSVITMTGGIEKFAELSSKYFESFYSESQQFEYLQQSLSEAFGTLGMSIAGSREEFKSMIDGIDLTTEAGQRLYASLLELVPGMDEYLSQLEDLASQELDLQIQLLKEMGKSEEALALERERELAGLDESLKSLMLQIYAQQDLNKAREEERKLLTDNVDFAKAQLEKARRAEIDRINATVTAAEEAYSSTIDSINLQREAYYKLIDDLESAVGSAKSALEKSLIAELSKYDELISAAQSNATDEISLINSISSARMSALNEELSIVSSVASQLGAASVGVSAIEALAAARAGNFEPATRINTGGDYSSALEQRIGQGRETFTLAEIGKLADSRLSDIERSILATESSAESQISAIESASNKEVKALQAERDAVEARILEVLGVDTKVLSLDEAVYAYQKAQDELANAMSDGTLLSLQAQEDLALQTLEQVKADAEEQINALNEQVDLLLGIDESVLSVDEAIKLLIEEEKALAEFEASIAEQQLLRQTETNAILDEINSNTREFIQDILYPMETPKQAEPNAEVVKELKELRKDLDNANAQIGENTARTASSIRNLEYMQSVK